ncbi:hypothetical protein PVL29_020481 [Vitis rotundifolia]|uniref:Cytochrome P450 n=1 Tax=Vitis rotundifolia TaxID=103349 RepID=A0AA38YXH9_VITRO|nr:hypothetical protein PVL29_020481 [Vitis rotundifolia]
MESKQEEDNNEPLEYVLSYVDTVLDLRLPEDNTKLEEGAIISLSSEFLVAGADTTALALQWIMANLVKYPRIQAKLFQEICGEDLQKISYLKAIVLEGLRRHPPSHLPFPRSVIREVVLNGYVIPKNAMVYFMRADIGWNPEVWEDPMEFRPERFLAGEVFDITGSREIKMMPFGAGRRMCPGYGLAMLHLEYFVANLVWKVERRAVDGDDIDLSEKDLEFMSVMKNTLQALISPRLK